MASEEVKEYPPSLRSFIEKYGLVWNKYAELGEAVSKAGPIPVKYQHLTKIAVHAVKKEETRFKTHVRKALRAGATPAEINHAIIQLLTTEGIGTTIMCLNWADEVIQNERKK